VLICLDADDQVDIHKAFIRQECLCVDLVHLIYVLHSVSLPIHFIHYLKQWNKLLWYESSESLVSVALFHRLR